MRTKNRHNSLTGNNHSLSNIILSSLVKLHSFQFTFLENCVHKKQKKSIKKQRDFCSNSFFKVFANFVSAHSKIWCLRFFSELNDIIFFIFLVTWGLWGLYVTFRGKTMTPTMNDILFERYTALFQRYSSFILNG